MSGSVTMAQVLAGNIPLASNRDLIERIIAERETRFVALTLRPGIGLSRNMILHWSRLWTVWLKVVRSTFFSIVSDPLVLKHGESSLYCAKDSTAIPR